MSASSNNGKVLCSYYMNGACSYGSACRFSHDMSHKPSNVCKYYQLGRCAYGPGCRYDHVKPDRRPERKSAAGPSPSPAAAKSEAARKLVPLKKGKDYRDGAPAQLEATDGSACSGQINRGQFSYSDAVKATEPSGIEAKPFDLCPLAEKGYCPYEDSCEYIHGLECSMCQLAVLHPNDPVQREQHHEACLAAHEQAMECAFAAQRSADKQCTICMETVVEKASLGARRFGILSSCNHVFCLACIRKWRLGEDVRLNVEAVRSCPECRVVSHYVVPSEFWVEAGDEKEKLIADYKDSLKKRHCQYFDRGKGQCPFSSSCFYLHAYPDGREAPAVLDLPRRRYNDSAELERENRVTLWDFLLTAATRDDSGQDGAGRDSEPLTEGAGLDSEPSAESAIDAASTNAMVDREGQAQS